MLKECPQCGLEKEKYHKGKKICADCTNNDYNERNKIINYKQHKLRRGMTRVKILNASKQILNKGEVLSARTIAKAIGSKNSGVVNQHFGSMNNLIMILQKGLDDE